MLEKHQFPKKSLLYFFKGQKIVGGGGGNAALDICEDFS
jgi:hypothetical protein